MFQNRWAKYMVLCWGMALAPLLLLAQPVLRATNGVLRFTSEAPLELIQAASNQTACALDVGKRTFAFSVPMQSFQGFNSGLQRQHFNENYVQSARYPYGTFKGKIIEEVNLQKNGTYAVRAKGLLNVHGVEQERIIKATVVVTNQTVNVASKFAVALVDHKIQIPRIVSQKIAENIQVQFNALLRP